MSEAPKDGKHVEYVFYENGQKEGEVHFKNGKLDGLSTLWHENGQKADEIPYKNGKTDGLWTQWYENGQKKVERHYKDGKEVSRKEF